MGRVQREREREEREGKLPTLLLLREAGPGWR